MSSRTLRTVHDLFSANLVNKQQATLLHDLEQVYAIAISPEMTALINASKGYDDPIGRQYIPHPEELQIHPDELKDPIGDEALSPIPGIVHRYEDRVLLKPLLLCPVYCRFCFRREQIGPDQGMLNDQQLDNAMKWIADHPKIQEVILSGGDPFILSARRMQSIIQQLNQIPHITTLRIHTRVPFSAPTLLQNDFIESLVSEKALWVVVHANHPVEFTPLAHHAIKRLIKQGIPLLSQSVLLKNVNDTPDILEKLLRNFVEWRIKPYYLHQLDKAPGTRRFHVPIERGRILLQNLRGRVTGLAWPTYVLDIPGGYGKVPLGPDYYTPETPHVIRDPDLKTHKI